MLLFSVKEASILSIIDETIDKQLSLIIPHPTNTKNYRNK